jgi:DNA-binding IclR family transcriptional regulator
VGAASRIPALHSPAWRSKLARNQETVIMSDIAILAPDKAPPSEKNQVQVIARAAAILRSLEDEPVGLSLGQIAQRVGLARSTVQRIVAALQAEKLLMSASPTGRVMLGPAILRLAGSVRSDFVSLVRPFLVKLSSELRETVDLAVVKKNQLVFIDQVVGSQRLRTVSAVGETFPLYCTANGKAYLATLDDRSVERLMGRQFEPRTPNTRATLPQLLADLAEIRKAGIAYDREEHMLGISAAGIALQDPIGNWVAISVPVPAARFAEIEAQLVERLLEIKERLQDLVRSER